MLNLSSVGYYDIFCKHIQFSLIQKYNIRLVNMFLFCCFLLYCYVSNGIQHSQSLGSMGTSVLCFASSAFVFIHHHGVVGGNISQVPQEPTPNIVDTHSFGLTKSQRGGGPSHKDNRMFSVDCLSIHR